MSQRIRCFTLFDITQTGITNRIKRRENEDPEWILKRNSQCNFDTLLQVISLRSQPEVVKLPDVAVYKSPESEYFGFLYKQDNKVLIDKFWFFEFEVQHSSVFEDGIVLFGNLYKDCEGVPMITMPNQPSQLISILNTSEELKNIHFEMT